jgi:hypothetical protein
VHDWQVVDETAPRLVEYVPDRQVKQNDVDIMPTPVEYVPAPQFKHVADEMAPMLLEYFPVVHAQQEELDAIPTLVE